ncbi:glutathione S-transferase T3-like [Lotus japonicus]|uniref:glutathione S-transferase T3-like n=1 Tax=Lotus japonicus TaxID=34305 RepID=UPI002585407C|nr:glutathione S-transferase T3-like [Lotus japonicus]
MGPYSPQMPYPNNPQYCVYPPQYQFQNQAPPTGSSSSKVSDTQCEAMPDEPEFSTQRGLDDIELEETGKKRNKWSGKDNILLHQSWLNVSTDPIVGNDQKSTLFWDRIQAQYEEYRDPAYPSRSANSLKSHFSKLNADIQIFVGCHNKATSHWKSGHSDKDIMATAHSIYHVDTGKDFKHENAWRLVKDEPKWKGTFMTTSSTRQKKSGDGAYATSSDPSASIEGDEYEATQPATRPKGKKNIKRKAKVGDTASSEPLYVPNSDMVAIGNAKIDLLASFKELKTQELEMKKEKTQIKKEKTQIMKAKLLREYRDILMQDTSNMNEVQLAAHQRLCQYAMNELGMS